MSFDNGENAAKYRRKAQDLRTIGEKITINKAREELLETAEHLEELAQDEERKARTVGSDPQLRSDM